MIVKNNRGTILAGVFLFFVTMVFSASAADKDLSESLEKLRAHCLSILQETLKSEEAFVRSGAVRAAGESESRDVLPLLKKGAVDFFPTTRQFALQGLKKVSAPEALTQARKALSDSNIWVKATALEIIAESGDASLSSAVRPLRESPDPLVRLGSLYALYRLGETEQLTALLKAVDGGDAIRRYQAITYLGKIDDPKATTRLYTLLEEEQEDEILVYALKAIDERGEIELLRPLENLLKHKNPRVRQQALMVLRYLPTQVALSRVTPLCVDKDPLVQVTAAMATVHLGSTQCDEIFTMAVKHADYGVRSVAARVLGDLDLSNEIPLLLNGLNDSNSRVRTAAVRSAGKHGGAKMFPMLLQMLDDSTPVIRAYAAGYLLKLLNPAPKVGSSESASSKTP